MKKPKWMSKDIPTSYDRSRMQAKSLSKLLKMEETPGSGNQAPWFLDLIGKDKVCELKTTTYKSFRLNRDELKKEILAYPDKIWFRVISFTNEVGQPLLEVVVMRLKDFLLEGMNDDV